MNGVRHLYMRVRGLRDGQTMAEYALILLAIAIVAFVGYQAIGTTISSSVTQVNGLF